MTTSDSDEPDPSALGASLPASASTPRTSPDAPEGIPLPAPRCLVCEYSLEGLPPGPCPECGYPFDPAKPSTEPPPPTHTTGWGWLEGAAWLCSPGPLYTSTGVGLMYLLA